MKKIILSALLVSFGFATVSCSGDDSAEVNVVPTQEALTIKFNEEVKNFESITVHRGNGYKRFNALEKGKPQNSINFEIHQHPHLPDEMRYLKYYENGERVFYNESPDCTVTIHNRNLLKGYFTGTYNQEDNGNVINGSFTIYLSDL